MTTFAQKPTYQSDDKFDLGVSDDRKAFTLTFEEFQVTADTGRSPSPMASRFFHLILPLENDDNSGEIAFGISGAALTRDSSAATIVFSVNGKTTVTDFTANADQSFVHEVKFKPESASECRIALLLLAGRDSTKSQTGALLSVSTIDAEIRSTP
jgi:hypothetical protein